MTDNERLLFAALRRQRAAETAGRLLIFLLDFILLSADYLVFLSAAAALNPAPQFFTFIFFCFAAIAAAYTFFFIYKLSGALSQKNIIARLCRQDARAAKLLPPAADIASGKTAGTYAPQFGAEQIALAAKAAQKLSSAWPRPAAARVFAAAALTLGALAAAQAAHLSPRTILMPWKPEPAEARISIKPGNVSVLRGTPVAITASWLFPSSATPVLFLRGTNSGQWRTQPWQSAGGQYLAAIPAVTDALQYKIRAENTESSVYEIMPEDYPAPETEEATIYPPAYLKTAPYKYNGEPVPALSTVKFTITTSEPAEEASLQTAFCSPEDSSCPPANESRMRKISPTKFIASIGITRDTAYAFSITSPSGLRDPAPPQKTLFVRQDLPPTASILSPEYPLEASREDAVNLVYSVQDDIGIARAQAVISADNRQQEILPLPAGGKTHTGKVLLTFADYPDKTRLSVTVKACDANSQCAASAPLAIYIKDFSQNAGQFDKRLEAAIAALGELSAAQTAPAAPDYMSALWAKNENLLSALNEAAKNDPYAPAGAQYAIAAARGDIAAAKARGTGPEASARINAARENLLSLMRRRQLRNMELSALGMADRIAAINDSLKDNRRPDPKTAAMLSKLMAEIEKRLAEMKAAMSARGETKAGEGVYSMPVTQAEDEAAALNRALAEGHFEDALSHAAKLLEQIESIRNLLSSAQGDEMRQSALGPQQQKIMEKLKATIEDLLTRQTAAAQDTADLLDRQTAAKAARQKELIARSVTLAQENIIEAKKSEDILPLQTRQRLGEMAGDLLLGKNLSALETARAAEAEIRSVHDSTDTYRARLGELYRSHKLVLTNLSDALSADLPFSDADIKQANAFADIETKLADETGEAARMSASPVIPAAVQDDTESAAREMNKAADAFTSRKTRPAADGQNAADDYLQKALDELQKALDAASQAQSHMRMPQNSPTLTRQNQGTVPLPDAAQYMPPAQLRGEALRSGQEKYPRKNAGEIRLYLQNIAR